MYGTTFLFLSWSPSIPFPSTTVKWCTFQARNNGNRSLAWRETKLPPYCQILPKPCLATESPNGFQPRNFPSSSEIRVKEGAESRGSASGCSSPLLSVKCGHPRRAERRWAASLHTLGGTQGATLRAHDILLFPTNHHYQRKGPEARESVVCWWTARLVWRSRMRSSMAEDRVWIVGQGPITRNPVGHGEQLRLCSKEHGKPLELFDHGRDVTFKDIPWPGCSISSSPALPLILIFFYCKWTDYRCIYLWGTKWCYDL